MATEVNAVQQSLVKARILLGGNKQHDETWCAAVGELIIEVGNHILEAQANVERTADIDVRQQTTNLIGELISTRQRLERARDTIESKPPSFLEALKHRLGLAIETR